MKKLLAAIVAILLVTTSWCSAQPWLQKIQQENLTPVLVASNDVPAFAAFWSLQRTNYPPNLINKFPDLPVYYLGYGNAYLIDDLSVDYEALNEEQMWFEYLFGLNSVFLDDPDAGAGMAASAYPSNALYLEITRVTNGLAHIILHGTVANTTYEILSRRELNSGSWASEGFVIGKSEQNWTAAMIPVLDRTNRLFFWARAWQDSDGDGLPDWFEIEVTHTDPNNPDTGNTGVSDANKDSDGDGWMNLEEYQMGTNPNSFDTPRSPDNFVAEILGSATSVTLTWSAVYGPVIEYIIERADPPSYTYQEIARVNSSSTSYVDTGSFVDDDLEPDSSIPTPGLTSFRSSYRLQARYTNGPSGWVSAYINGGDPALTVDAKLVRNHDGRWQLMASPIPKAVSALRLFWFDWDYVYDTGDATFEDLAVTSLSNRTYVFPDSVITNHLNQPLVVVGLGATNKPGKPVFAGIVSGDAPYFVDARQHLKENLTFLTRAAGTTRQWLNGYYEFQPGTNFETVSFFHPDLQHKSYVPDDIPFVALDNLWPVAINYFLRNSLYITNEPGPFAFEWNLDFATVPAPPLLANEEPYFITQYVLPAVLFGPQDLSSLLDWGALYSNGTLSLFGDTRNYFGLASSNVLAYSRGPLDPVTGLRIPHEEWPSIAPGNSFTFAYTNWTLLDYYFSNFRPPGFLNVGYYFAPVASSGVHMLSDAVSVESQPYPVPIQASFSVTNQSPLVITPFGKPIVFGGWSKLAITNGYNDCYAYLGQYFDKALKITNGVVLTNETGVLSPYGEFFPTEPGPTALITMPDGVSTERGTNVVYVVKLQFDVNHDGKMDLAFDGPDNTSESRPFSFWLNNDLDEPAVGQALDHDVPMVGAVTNNDYSFGNMRNLRNMEDFARLWLCGIPALPADQGYSVQISWGKTNAGAPRIRLYYSSDINGGIGYLTNTTAAWQQLTNYGIPIGEVTTTNSVTLPASWFTNGIPRCLLFEGGKPGSGGLTLTISKGATVVAKTTSWLDLYEMSEFYERPTIANVERSWPAMVTTSPTASVAFYPRQRVDISQTNQVAVFIHGWRMSYADYQSFSQTMFKRMYWQGYQGRFVALQWPTRSEASELFPWLGYLTYNRSEHIAFKSGKGTALYLQSLRNRFPDCKISLCCHSMGGIVTMETLKELVSQGQRPVDNVVFMEAAVPAHCFDTNAATVSEFTYEETFAPTPDTYRNYGSGVTNALREGGKLFNYFNPEDFALNTWNFNQGLYITNFLGAGVLSMKPNVPLGYYTDGVNSTLQTNFWNQSLYSLVWFGGYNGPTRSVTNAHELMAFVSRPRGLAIGEYGGLHGQFVGQEFNLQTQLGYTGVPDDHSGQFNRSIQQVQVWQFYFRLLSDLFPP